MKQEFLEGLLESPTLNEESVAEQLRGAFDQASTALQQLPLPIRDALAAGLKLPLGQFLFKSYVCTFRQVIVLS